MKVVLFALNSSYTHTNLALRCLRAPLEGAGFDVVLSEYNMKDNRSEVLCGLYNEEADIYGFSAYIWNIDEMLAFANDLSKIRPKSKIIFGGPEVSFDAERFEGCSFIDCIITGEGEESFLELCEKIKHKESFPKIIIGKKNDAMHKEGILYRSEDVFSGCLVYYESSRGCPFNCSYCLSCATRGVEAKTAVQTLHDLDEFEKLGGDYKIIKFIDRTFNFDIQRANDIWRALLDDGRYTKKYHFEICISLLNEESFTILSQFTKGKIQLEVGLQSTNPETLAEISRHVGAQQVIEYSKRIRKMGNIHLHVDLIAGLPYESYRRFGQSFNEAYGCCDMLQLGFLKLLHGTKLRCEAEKHGYKFKNSPPYTVLENNYISYPEIVRLEQISDLCDRYCESGRFLHSIAYAVENCTIAPFEFYEGLLDFITQNDGRRIRKISQPDAYRLLKDYFYSICGDKTKQNGMDESIRADYMMNEMRKMPKSI